MALARLEDSSEVGPPQRAAEQTWSSLHYDAARWGAGVRGACVAARRGSRPISTRQGLPAPHWQPCHCLSPMMVASRVLEQGGGRRGLCGLRWCGPKGGPGPQTKFSLLRSCPQPTQTCWLRVSGAHRWAISHSMNPGMRTRPPILPPATPHPFLACFPTCKTGVTTVTFQMLRFSQTHFYKVSPIPSLILMNATSAPPPAGPRHAEGGDVMFSPCCGCEDASRICGTKVRMLSPGDSGAGRPSSGDTAPGPRATNQWGIQWLEGRREGSPDVAEVRPPPRAV